MLGDPDDDPVIVEGWTQLQVIAKETATRDATSLALKLLDVFFTKKQMGYGCCTEVEGRGLLRQDIINGIHSK